MLMRQTEGIVTELKVQPASGLLAEELEVNLDNPKQFWAASAL